MRCEGIVILKLGNALLPITTATTIDHTADSSPLVELLGDVAGEIAHPAAQWTDLLLSEIRRDGDAELFTYLFTGAVPGVN